MLSNDEIYMQRCFDLAANGGKNVRPNPLVGAILVHQNRIIGEGYHHQFGSAHAEVEAINSVKTQDRDLIPDSTLYVSLEPCNYHGKTPACSRLIIDQGIRKLVVSTEDPNPMIKGNSLQYLEQMGITITRNVLSEKGKDLIKVFSKNIKTSKPYVIIKYAESKDHFIGKQNERIKLSNDYSDIFVHKLRDYADGIMVGTNTALTDNPSLTTRLIDGDSPVRIVLDRQLKIPITFNIYNKNTGTIIINQEKNELKGNIDFCKMDFERSDFLNDLLLTLFRKKVYVLLVEGGSQLINSLLHTGEWDEAVIITTPVLLNSGIKAPSFSGQRYDTLTSGADFISFVKK